MPLYITQIGGHTLLNVTSSIQVRKHDVVSYTRRTVQHNQRWMALTGGASSEPQCLVVQEDCAEGYASFSLGHVPCYFGLASNSLSFVASIAMVAIYIAWKDLRKGAQSIVTFIAIADFFTAAAYFAGCINIMLTSYNETSRSKCRIFLTVCEIESYVMTCATMSSYLWTLILAFHLYLVVVKGSGNLANKLMPVYHVTGWGLPVAVTFPLLFVGKLAYAPFVAAVWCYLESSVNHDLPSARQLPLAIAIKLPEILGYVLIIFFYTATRVCVYTQVSWGEHTGTTIMCVLWAHVIVGPLHII